MQRKTIAKDRNTLTEQFGFRSNQGELKAKATLAEF